MYETDMEKPNKSNVCNVKKMCMLALGKMLWGRGKYNTENNESQVRVVN
jgi:hypothetical protein